MTAAVGGRPLCASAHDISRLTIGRAGRRRSAIERLINTRGVELSDDLLGPSNVEARTRRGIQHPSRGDVGRFIAGDAVEGVAQVRGGVGVNVKSIASGLEPRLQPGDRTVSFAS